MDEETNKVNARAIAIRSAKTFMQAFCAAWAVTGYDFGKGALIGALAAGGSALMNLFISPQEAK